MYIFQRRLGFATNSSSTHSLVDCREQSLFSQDYRPNTFAYGQENFSLVSPEGKAHYLACQLWNNLERRGSDQKQTKRIIKRELGKFLKEYNYSYIDGQSILDLPSNYTNDNVNLRFFRELRDVWLQEGIVIVGNEDQIKSPSFRVQTLYHSPLVGCAGEFITRHEQWVDQKGNNFSGWVLFDRDLGTKYRISLRMDGGIQETRPHKGRSPELVDMKISDYCPYECPFCYMGSTKSGRHADPFMVESLLESFSSQQVFEVAFGGGEPTLHPNFFEFLPMSRKLGIIPNFTTRNLGWLREWKKVLAVLENCGGFAYSIHCPGDVDRLVQALDDAGLSLKHRSFTKPLEIGSTFRSIQVNAQIVMGTMDKEGFLETLRRCFENRLQPVFLGYKTTGFGGSFLPQVHDYSNWVWWWKEGGHHPTWDITVGVDTLLASQSRQELRKIGIPESHYEIEEGGFSMYVDAVTQKAASSSFVSSENMRDFQHVDEVMGLWQTFVPQKPFSQYRHE